MPHLIIEYSETVATDTQVEAMMDAVHDAAFSTGLFEEANIKVRAIPLRHYQLGREKGGFIHVQCRIQTGRSAEQKRTLSGAILEALNAVPLAIKALTVEVVDMDTATYAKHTY